MITNVCKSVLFLEKFVKITQSEIKSYFLNFSDFDIDDSNAKFLAKMLSTNFQLIFDIDEICLLIKDYNDYVKRIISLNVGIICFKDDTFRKITASIKSNYPLLMYYKGDIKLLNKVAVAVVGARKNTSYGQSITKQFVQDITLRGATIVSGLASGIDTVAHEQTLLCGGKTIAVLGCGINVIYPRTNSDLYNAVAEKGLIMSEYGLDVKANAFQFPQRNRIISALSDCVLVIEAMKKSGALITADIAKSQGKPLYAVCGDINSLLSMGTNELIKCGKAKLVTNPNDIIFKNVSPTIDKIREINDNNIDAPNGLPLDEFDAEIIKFLKFGKYHVEELLERLSLPIDVLNSKLVTLEIFGLISRQDNNTYCLSYNKEKR